MSDLQEKRPVSPEGTNTPPHDLEKAALHEQDSHTSEASDFPTDEERHTLRRVSDKIPIKAYTIGFVELVERLSFYGTTAVFVNFIQHPNPGTSTGKPIDPNASQAVPGALGRGQQASTGLTTFNQFWVYCVPLFGAYIADTYTGRYKAILYAIFVAIIGHVILVASAAPKVIEHPNGALAAFVIGLIVMGLGTGVFKPNISPLVAEQVPTRMHVRTEKSGERVLIDPAVTLSRTYNWFYLFINIGALVGQIAMVYAERYVGFWLSYLIPTIAFCLTPLVMILCKNWYKHTPPTGSVLMPAIKILLRGTKGRWHANPVATYKHMNDGTFWDNVKPSHIPAGERPAWMDFDDAWVDEVRRGWTAVMVFCYYPLWWLTYNQINNNLTSQAATMELHGVPNDVVNNLDPFALIILIPICDLFIYPFLRKMGINFSPLKRIAAGFFTGTLAMIWACVLQWYIYKTSACGNQAGSCDTPAPINVWAQTGSYVLIAISEIFASITGLEYAFSKAPKNMRSLVMSVFLFTSAIAAALGQAFNPLSADPLLVWNYGSMGVLSFIGGVLFWWSFHGLDKAEDELNTIRPGKVHGMVADPVVVGSAIQVDH